MDLTEMRAEVRNRLGEDTEDYWKTTQIDRALNEALKRFCREDRWPWLYKEATVALALDATDIVLPDDIDFARVLGFALKDAAGNYVSPPPKRVGAYEGFRLKQVNTTAGVPRWFYMASTALATPAGAGDEALVTTIRFIPKADKAYTAEFSYFRRPSKLDDINEEPDLPEDFHGAVVAFATGTLWEAEQGPNSTKAADQYAHYEHELQLARRDLFGQGEDEELVIGKESDEYDYPAQKLPRLPDTYGWHGSIF